MSSLIPINSILKGSGEKHFKRQSQLLLVSLLENFINSFDQSPELNSKLFLEICKKLTLLGIIQNEDVLEGIAMASTYKQIFKTLIIQALQDISTIKLLQPAKENPLASLFDDSRYSNEFNEISLLGKGGFGQVWKVLNRLDGVEYAVKKVLLQKPIDFDKITREVKLLARLSHQNVVRYFTSWIEHGVYKNMSDGDWESIGDSSCSEDTSELINSAGITDPVEIIPRSASDSQESSNVSKETQLVLYIQMELCGESLEDWISSRNSKNDPRVYVEEIQDIFFAIVSGLEYIHSQGFIHRDLKPLNIFKQYKACKNSCSWKLGDFGLATSIDRSNIVSESDESSSHRLSLGVGTVTYSAPETLTDFKYTTQADIYSLGIVLFELIYPFKTQMEKSQVLNSLKNGMLPDDFVTKYPKEMALILWLMSENPSHRPTASQLLEFEILRTKVISTSAKGTQTDDHLLEQINILTHEKNALLERIKALELEIMEIKSSK